MSTPRFLSLVVLATCLAVPSAAAEPVVTSGFGLNVCLSERNEDCDTYGSAAFLWFAGGYRFGPHLETTLDLHLGWLDSQSAAANQEQSMQTRHFLPTVRTRWDWEGFEMFVGLGVGYGDEVRVFRTAGVHQSQEWSSWLAVKVGGGLSKEVYERVDVGLNVDMFFQGGGERCTDTGTLEQCSDVTDIDAVRDLFQMGLFGRYRF